MRLWPAGPLKPVEQQFYSLIFLLEAFGLFQGVDQLVELAHFVAVGFVFFAGFGDQPIHKPLALHVAALFHEPVLLLGPLRLLRKSPPLSYLPFSHRLLGRQMLHLGLEIHFVRMELQRVGRRLGRQMPFLQGPVNILEDDVLVILRRFAVGVGALEDRTDPLGGLVNPARWAF